MSLTVFEEVLLLKGGIAMARPKKQFPPSKDRFVGVRMTNELYEVISKNADMAHLSVSEYLRLAGTEAKIIVHQEVVFDSTELLKALGDIGKIGSNLNQIAHHLNGGGTFTDGLRHEIMNCISSLYQIRDNIKIMAGEYRGSH